MLVELSTPVRAGEDLNVRVTITNSFSEEPIGTMVIISTGLYDFGTNIFIDKFCDSFDINNEPVGFGNEVVHNLSCKIPQEIITREGDLVVKAGYTPNVGSVEPGDYSLIDQRIYKFDIEGQPEDKTRDIMLLILGAIVGVLIA